MNVFEAAAKAYRTGNLSVLATIIRIEGSTPRSETAKMLIRVDGSFVGTVGGGALEFEVLKAAKLVLETRKARTLQFDLRAELGMCCGGQVEVFLEPIQPKAPIWIFGAGHVARKVAPILVAADYDVTVVDHREDWAVEEAFEGCNVILASPDHWLSNQSPTSNTYVLIVTHDHAMDQQLVADLLPIKLAWLGMIGSKAKVARFFTRLAAAGMDESLFNRLCAPVGLDIGAETPAEIAVSIAAEVIRVRRLAKQTPLPLSSSPLGLRDAAIPGKWA